MNIGQRLRELRLAKGMSQGDIEKRTGIFRCYVSRVEGGYIAPQLPMLKKIAKALQVPLHEVFIGEKLRPASVKIMKVTPFEKRLFISLRRTDDAGRRLFLSVADRMAKRNVKRNRG